jgi:type IV secretory pathway VirB3-like protein
VSDLTKRSNRGILWKELTKDALATLDLPPAAAGVPVSVAVVFAILVVVSVVVVSVSVVVIVLVAVLVLPFFIGPLCRDSTVRHV